jgi:hypothetical protein
MPHRFVSVAILIAWSFATGALVVRDVMPDYVIGPPPDLRSITMAKTDEEERPIHWSILVAEDPDSLNFRSVGQVTTETLRQSDGDVRVSSSGWFDASEALKDTPLARTASVSRKIVARGSYNVDASGNLTGFWAAVEVAGDPKNGITLNGRVRKNHLEITAEGPLPIMNWKKSMPYETRGIVQNVLSPLDRMPGLQIGQRWNSRIVSPLTGRVEDVTVEVARKRVITWDANPVTTLEVVTSLPWIKARTWVRPDGLVLRQEAPFPFVKLLLDRQPDQVPPDSIEDRRR